jgi:hypothetical protein
MSSCFASISVVCITFSATLFVSCGSSGPEQSAGSANAGAAVEMNAPLRSFSEDIQSPLKSLEMKPSEQVFVPITVRNTSQEPWSSVGQYPVNISYKWFENGKMLPIEGERTPLPTPIQPNSSAAVQVKVVAPGAGQDLVLKISLVQESVQWFMIAGAKPLELPVTLK